VSPAGFERYFRLASAAVDDTEPPPEALGPRPVTEHVGPPITRTGRQPQIRTASRGRG
jgi:hypothetical protein